MAIGITATGAGITVIGAGAIVIGAGVVAGTAATGVTGNAAPGMKKGIAMAIPFFDCVRPLNENAKDQNGRQRPAYQRKP